MPDPALLAVIQHLASPPATIMLTAGLVDSEPLLSAYELIDEEQDRVFAAWLANEPEVRRTVRQATVTSPHDFTPQLFEQLIGPVERRIRSEQKITARLERRGAGHLSPRLQRLWHRIIVRQHRQYKAAGDLVRFLRDLQNEAVSRQREAWKPNATTVAAMLEARSGDLPKFASVADLMADLDADD